MPNPSFEDTLFCPTDVVGFQQDTVGAVGWYSFRNSPDYYNSCHDTSISHVSVPINIFGYQSASTGNAYIGMQCFFTTNFREFLGSELNSQLIIGQKYYVSLKVNCAVGGRWGISPSNGAVNKLGVLFSTVPYNSINGAPLNNFAHVYTDSIITDTLNWFKINGTFVADSAYNYIIIGNFFDDAHTDTLSIFQIPNYFRAYYYIDDVCVSTDSNYCAAWTGIKEIPKAKTLTLSPNPNNGNFTVNYTLPQNKEGTLQILDVMGKQVYKQTLPPWSVMQRINLPALAKGIYVLKVSCESNSTAVKFVKE